MNAIGAHLPSALYLDLEWACADGPEAGRRPVEIIEIGAVEADLATLEIIREAAYLVRPRHLEISLRCTRITGLEEHDLRKAARLSEAVRRFEREFSPAEKICVTWGNDTEIFAQACGAYGLSSPFRKVLDLSQLFRQACLLPQQPGLTMAIGLFGLPFDGVAHTALADARNTARVHLELLRRLRGGPDRDGSEPIEAANAELQPTFFGEKLLRCLSSRRPDQ